MPKVIADHSNNLAIPVRLAVYDDSDPPALVEAGSDRPVPVIQVPHLRVHEGRRFVGGYLWPSTAKIADNAFADFAITTPATGNRQHAQMTAHCGGAAELYLYESATITGGSTVGTANKNRNSTSVSGVVCTVGFTISSPGNLLDSTLVTGSSGPSASSSTGGQGDFSDEFVLKPPTTYVYRLKNVSGSAQPAHLNLSWYE